MRFGVRAAGTAAATLMVARTAAILPVGPMRFVTLAAIVAATMRLALAIGCGRPAVIVALAALRTIVAPAIGCALAFALCRARAAGVAIGLGGSAVVTTVAMRTTLTPRLAGRPRLMRGTRTAGAALALLPRCGVGADRLLALGLQLGRSSEEIGR